MSRRPICVALIAAAAVSLAACGNDNDNNTVNGVATPPTILGSTPGWFNGDVVTFDYTQPFQ